MLDGLSVNTGEEPKTGPRYRVLRLDISKHTLTETSLLAKWLN